MAEFKWIWGYLKKYRYFLLTAFIIVVSANLLNMINPYVQGIIVDRVIKEGHTEILLTLAMIINIITFLTVMIILFSINAFFTLILLCVTPVTGFFACRLAGKVKPAFSAIREQFSRLNSVVQENISGNRVIKAFASEDYEIYKFSRENEGFRDRNTDAVAIVGATGSGKSTLVNLISRFYDCTGGEILIDGTNIKEYDLKCLRENVSVAMQDIFLFALARALLADPRILILDEATSSIDTKTELALQEGLERLLKGRTSFIIAHRLSTIRKADRIMYIDNGRIVQQGAHDELMAERGAYWKLYTAQYRLLDAI